MFPLELVLVQPNLWWPEVVDERHSWNVKQFPSSCWSLVTLALSRICNAPNHPPDQHCIHFHHLALLAIQQLLTLYKPLKCLTSCSWVKTTSKILAAQSVLQEPKAPQSVSISCCGARSWFALLFTFSAYNCPFLWISVQMWTPVHMPCQFDCSVFVRAL